MMHPKKRQKVSSFLGDKLTTSFRQGTSEISTVKERSHIANAHLKIIKIKGPKSFHLRHLHEHVLNKEI